MDDRETASPPPPMPPALASLVDGVAWSRDLVGESGGAVYRLSHAGERDLYLKHGSGDVARDITDEMVRLQWLRAHVPVPQVRHFTVSDDGAWLLMTALPGRTAFQLLTDAPDRRRDVVTALAAFLRTLHAVPVEACPFDAGREVRLAHARIRMDAGDVDEDDFGDDHEGWTARAVWDEMMTLAPGGFDRVVTHGDFSLDNILMEDGRVTGWIDVGRAGVADPYQDLAILWNCLGEFDAALQDVLFDAYGIAAPDRRRIAFHLCLDEFF